MTFRTMLLATAFGAAAIGTAAADGETIAVFTKNQTNPYFEAIRIGADKAAADMSAETIQYVPTKADAIPEQMSQVEDVIIRKPDAVVFVPVDYMAMVPAVLDMNDAGIPVVNVGERTDGGEYVSFVGASDYDIGVSTAKALFDAMDGKGKIVILEGVPGTATSQDRMRGFNDAMKDYPDIEVLATQPANYQRLQALQVMENLMQSYPEMDGVLAANDTMALGAMEALDGANRSAKIVGINASAEAVTNIEDGKMLASGDYNGFLMGCIGTMIALHSLRGDEVPQEVILEPTVVTKDNVDEYKVPVAERECPSWEDVQAMASN